MKDIRCLLGFHRWSRGRDDDGVKMIVCRRCGKQDHDPSTGMLPLA
jgi:hypothetical protein